MRKLFLSFLSLIVINLFVFSETQITFVCEDSEDYPSVIGNSNKLNTEKPGLTVESLNYIGKKLGFTVKVLRCPWKRAFESELKNNAVDGLFLASYKKEREEFGVYPTKNGKVNEEMAFYNSSYYFYRVKGSSVSYDGKTLTNIKGPVGAPRGYSIVEDIKKMGLTVEESDSTTVDFKKMASGRIEVAVALKLTADNLFKNNKELADKIEKIDIPLVNKPYFVMFSKKFYSDNKDLADKIWAELKQLRSRDYDNIAERY